jgi:hypothetical protein
LIPTNAESFKFLNFFLLREVLELGSHERGTLAGLYVQELEHLVDTAICVCVCVGGCGCGWVGVGVSVCGCVGGWVGGCM